MIRTSNLDIRVLVKFSKSDLRFGFERTPCEDSDSRFEIRPSVEYLRFVFEILVKIFPGKIRIDIRPNPESYGILDSRFGYVTLQCVTTIIIKLYRWGEHPFVFSKTICVILSFFVFSITVL